MAFPHNPPPSSALLQRMIQAHLLDMADPIEADGMVRVRLHCLGGYGVVADKTSLHTVVRKHPSTMDDEVRDFQRELLAVLLAKGRGSRYYQVRSVSICTLKFSLHNSPRLMQRRPKEQGQLLAQARDHQDARIKAGEND